MAKIPLKEITFPGLDNTYTIPEIDSTLSTAGKAADAKETGDKISELMEDLTHAFPHDTASGTVASFADGADDVPMDSVVVSIEPVQSGSGDPSPTNVRPISGWSEVNAQRTGKNMYRNGNTGTFIREKLVVLDPPIPKGKTIISALLTTNSNKNCNVQAYENANVSGRTSTLYMTPNTGVRTATVAQQRDWEIRALVFRTGTNWADADGISGSYEDIQIEFGDTATAYEPYSGQSINIQLGQTVYGGKLDVTKGELVIDRAMYDGGALTWEKVTGSSFRTFFARTPNKIIYNNSLNTVVSSCYKSVSNNTAQANEDNYVWANSMNPTNGIAVKDTSKADMTASEFATAMDGVQFLCTLDAPLTVSLTPHEVRSLLGSNNVWADTGDTAVEYRADPTLYVQKKIAEAISALS